MNRKWGFLLREIRQRFEVLKVLIFSINTLLYWLLVAGLDETFLAPRHFVQYVFFYAAMILCLYAFRAYEYDRLPGLDRIVVSASAGVACGTLVTIPFMLLFSWHVPKATFAVLVLVSLCIITVSRALVVQYVKRTIRPISALVIGDKERWDKIIEEVKRSMGGKVHILDWLNPTPESLAAAAGRKLPCTVIVAEPRHFHDEGIKEAINRLKQQGCTVEMLPKVVEESLGRIPLQVAETFRNYYEMAFEMVAPDPRQRVFDMVCAAFWLVIGLPIAAAVAVAIVIDSGFPVLFRQKRIGMDGSPFTLHKFRTMVVHDDDREGDIEHEQQYITRVGRFIRRFRLDELPQLWDVLRGKMSLVGPRPEMERFHGECLENIPWYGYRLSLRPGITGWAQVNYRHTSTLEDYMRKTEYDLFYIKNRNLILDVQIALKTAETILGMRGAR